MHEKLLTIVNEPYAKCLRDMNVTEAGGDLRAVALEDSMTISRPVGCFLYCMTQSTSLIDENHNLDMIVWQVIIQIYETSLRPYPRVRAILSIMTACYMQMKNPARQRHCDLYNNLLKCVELYESKYGSYTVRPK
ncbi:hypothetical protein CBL_12871 [Carabus blaptoides fortunei]